MFVHPPDDDFNICQTKSCVVPCTAQTFYMTFSHCSATYTLATRECICTIRLYNTYRHTGEVSRWWQPIKHDSSAFLTHHPYGGTHPVRWDIQWSQCILHIQQGQQLVRTEHPLVITAQPRHDVQKTHPSCKCQAKQTDILPSFASWVQTSALVADWPQLCWWTLGPLQAG